MVEVCWSLVLLHIFPSSFKNTDRYSKFELGSMTVEGCHPCNQFWLHKRTSRGESV